MTKADVESILHVLTYRRTHLSAGEKQFIANELTTTSPSMRVDGIGNHFYTIHGKFGAMPTTLFTCHIDTCHHSDTPATHQIPVYDNNSGLVTCSSTQKDCLGADDGAGIWLLFEMIRANVPGVYAFFRGEERGGIGSKHAARTQPEFFKQFQRAVAFDRRGTADVITHQGHGRCCSDEFAEALAAELNGKGDQFFYLPSDRGVYTDTAELTDLIGECTNISCGYYHEHSNKETLDLVHLFALRDACLKVDWENLPTTRQPGEDDHYDFTGYEQLYPGFYSYKHNDKFAVPYPETLMDLLNKSPDDLADICSEWPDQTGRLLFQLINQ